MDGTSNLADLLGVEGDSLSDENELFDLEKSVSVRAGSRAVGLQATPTL